MESKRVLLREKGNFSLRKRHTRAQFDILVFERFQVPGKESISLLNRKWALILIGSGLTVMLCFFIYLCSDVPT